MLEERILKIRISGDSLISLSLYMFVFLYNLPITILIPDIIRKPLLILGVMIFAVGLLNKKAVYFLWLFIAIGFEVLFYIFSWSAKMSFSAFMFPSIVSIEFYICALLILDKKLMLSKRFLNCFVLIMLITSCTTIIGLLTYPTAIRTLGQISDETTSYLQNLYREHNIAGWNLLFGIGFFSGTLLYIYRKKKNILILITLITSVLCVLLSQLMFAILLTFFLIFLVFINGKNNRIVLRTMPFLILFFMLWVNKEAILLKLYSILSGTEMKTLALRIQNIYNLLIMKDTTGDAGARFERYTRSLNTFFNHPFGRYFSGQNNIINDIGFHSDFFDILGTLGIPGLFAIIALIVILLKKAKRITDIYNRRFYYFTCSVLLVMFFINPIMSHPHMWMSALLLPLVAINVMRNEQESIFK